MTRKFNTKQELIKLLQDVYEQGYMGGINDDKWLEAYARAMFYIMKGEEWSEELLDRCYRQE